MAVASNTLRKGMLLAVFVLGVFAIPADAAGSSVIHACYNNRTTGHRTHGNVRVLRPGQRCSPSESVLAGT